MTIKKHKDKNNNEWVWEETPDTIEALKQFHEIVKKTNERKETN
jgi:hypothetical protein